jgi:hypothetical protein
MKKAKTFIENAKSQLFTYVDNWLKTEISNPKVTSLVERMMREIKRRIKRIGYKWSEAGAEKMGTNANIKLSFLGVTVESLTLRFSSKSLLCPSEGRFISIKRKHW